MSNNKQYIIVDIINKEFFKDVFEQVNDAIEPRGKHYID